MSLFLYIIFSAVYLMTIHLAIAIRDHFNMFLMTGFFIMGGVVGYFLQSYEAGFAGAVIMTFLFW